ncbi:MAG: DNA repair protein RecN [Elusimicrobiota bacterium]|jgi:DNA repair protein RecN (Recombination protein N)
MLKSLQVKDFALLAEVRLEPGPGLSAFTGETGAGKSLLIEALGFLLGERGSADWIRAGAERLEVRGTFDLDDVPAALRKELGLSGSVVVLRRELDKTGRGRAFIGEKTVPVARLAELGEGLVDFHGQHEHQTLLKSAQQTELLDGFGGTLPLRGRYAAAWNAWRRLLEEKEALSLSEEERARRVELCRYQLQEIDEAELRPGEDEELERELPRLKNAAKLIEFSEQACELLVRQEGSAEELLSKAERLAAEIGRLDPGPGDLAEPLARARETLRETAASIADYRARIEERPSHIDAVLLRMDKLSKLKKKYGPTLQAVLEHREKTLSEANLLERREERAADMEADLAKAVAALEGIGGELHDARMKGAKKLSERVAAELKDLGMPSARFSVSVEAEDDAWTSTGGDQVEFLIAPNPGEPLKPLRSIASGGELSRIMLALKTVLARQDRVKLLVFDEVDSGVGGATARAVGLKLREIGRARQVLCVTHLPQVACFADGHFDVSKRVERGRTLARVERLEGESRLEVLARMLGGTKVTETARRHAQELLQSVQALHPL